MMNEGSTLLHDIGVETKGLDPPLRTVPWTLFNEVREDTQKKNSGWTPKVRIPPPLDLSGSKPLLFTFCHLDSLSGQTTKKNW